MVHMTFRATFQSLKSIFLRPFIEGFGGLTNTLKFEQTLNRQNFDTFPFRVFEQQIGID